MSLEGQRDSSKEQNPGDLRKVVVRQSAEHPLGLGHTSSHRSTVTTELCDLEQATHLVSGINSCLAGLL